MKRSVSLRAGIVLSAVMIFALAAQVLAAGVAKHMMPMGLPQPIYVAPKKSNSSQADKKAVFQFVNDNLPRGGTPLPSPVYVRDFGWFEVGYGKSDFAVLIDEGATGYNELWIYRRSGSRGARIQEIDGWAMGPFKQMVRDLNGDGRDELIISTSIVPTCCWRPIVGTPTWPAVYRLENGKYVEDSRDFPNYYDWEVLPRLDKEIARAEKDGSQYALAVNTLVKDKILRVLGRNPVAGLNDAYQWMNSTDPQLMQCALFTFSDIGDHEKEVRELQQALPAAITHEIESHKGG